jgi:NADH:ubiquinone oxidoreductase subunit C
MQMAERCPLAASFTELQDDLPQLLGRDFINGRIHAKDELTVTVRREAIARVLLTLRDEPRCSLQMSLSTSAGWIIPSREERFEVVYHLLSLSIITRASA